MKNGRWRKRCGSMGHRRNSFPMPYQPTPAFGRSNGFPSNPNRKILIDGEISKCDADSSVIPTSEIVDVGIEAEVEIPPVETYEGAWGD